MFYINLDMDSSDCIQEKGKDMTDKRIIDTGEIGQLIVDLVHKASFSMPDDVYSTLAALEKNEQNPLARETLGVLLENSSIAREKELPLCQDCGSVIVFLEIGQDVSLNGQPLNLAVDSAVEQAYRTFYLRKSIVEDPLRRKNTGTNTPAFIHTEIVPGSELSVTVYLKGGGSENMTVLKMFRPTEPVEGIIDFIASAVRDAGPNPCPPVFLGVGIGGTADVALVNSKKAVLRGPGSEHPDPFYRDLESRIMERVNMTGVGPLGFGGGTTAAGVYIIAAPSHIATLPVALNMNCHSLRYRTAHI